MIGAGYLDRSQLALESELLETIGGEVEVLEAPAHLLAGERLLAEPLLRGADRLDAEHGIDQSAHVENLTRLLPFRRAQALVVEVLLEILVQLEPTGGVLQGHRVVAGGTGLRRPHVRLGPRPPHAVHLLARIADRDRLLDGGRVHDAPAPQQHVVGAVLADLQPGCLLLDTGMRDRQEQRLESVHLRALLQQGDRLLAIGRVVIDEGDLLALELVEPAFLLGDVLQDDVGGRPIGAEQREVPLEHRAVARLRAAVAHGDDRDLVDRRLLRERKGDAGRERDHIGGAGRTLALEALVAFHAAVGGIAGVAFLEHDLDAVDAAVALIDELVVVSEAVGERNAVRGVGTGPVHQVGDELLVLRQRRRGRRQGARERRERDPDVYSSHRLAIHRHSSIDAPEPVAGGRPLRGSIPLLGPSVPANCRGLNTGTAIAEAFPWRSPTAGPARAARRSRRARSWPRTA